MRVPLVACRPGRLVVDNRTSWAQKAVATVYCILRIAQDMGEADLMPVCQVLLVGIAVEYPHIGAIRAQNTMGHGARPGWRDGIEDSVVADKNPLPPGDTIDPRCRFV